ncbi:lef12 [Hemileuca sp. nucleopolyhedrovirus]|uniref:Lef12 n=1 Tax=Hemileuca sp. nucleopolyhedrovirus TaxID=1367203 RepID=S5N357_9ABAC|nr:lef12 [Hemileuca sp. nucleopolyhedrovirus]AGR56785.1 lef12 [Hemileuca sp. nucleopolyhedrovirus]
MHILINISESCYIFDSSCSNTLLPSVSDDIMKTAPSNKIVVVTDREKLMNGLRHVEPFVRFMRLVVDEMVNFGEITQREAETLCLADDTAAWICGRIEQCNFVTFRLQSFTFVYREKSKSSSSSLSKTSSSSVLAKFNFHDHSLHQTILGRDWNNLIYFCCNKYLSAVVKLIICRQKDKDIVETNPCPQLSYFINISNIRDHIFSNHNDITNDMFVTNDSETTSLLIIRTKDCDCLRRNNTTVVKRYCNKDENDETCEITKTEYVNLIFDEDDDGDDIDPKLQHAKSVYRNSFKLQEDLVEIPFDDGTVKILCDCVRK